MDFGFSVQNMNSEQLYKLATDSGSLVGYGTLIVPNGDCRDTKTINIGDIEIGLIREVFMGQQRYVFIKVDGQKRGFTNVYLTSSSAEVIPNPNIDLYPFSLEIQQIDRYHLMGCYLTRFRLVKKPHGRRFFDSCVGDELFMVDETQDVLTKALLQPGVTVDEYYALRRAGIAAINDARPEPVVCNNLEIIEAPQNVVLRRKRNGRIFNYYQDVVSKVPVKQQTAVYTVVPRKVLNKVTLNFVNAPQVTKELLKANLGYINNCIRDIDLINDGIPAIMYAIKETTCLETLLSAGLASKDAELIAALKKDSFDIAPNGLKEAFQKGKLWAYIDYKLRNLVSLNDVKALESKPTSKLDFH
jgi:hypothetical protein